MPGDDLVPKRDFCLLASSDMDLGVFTHQTYFGCKTLYSVRLSLGQNEGMRYDPTVCSWMDGCRSVSINPFSNLFARIEIVRNLRGSSLLTTIIPNMTRG